MLSFLLLGNFSPNVLAEEAKIKDKIIPLEMMDNANVILIEGRQESKIKDNFELNSITNRSDVKTVLNGINNYESEGLYDVYCPYRMTIKKDEQVLLSVEIMSYSKPTPTLMVRLREAGQLKKDYIIYGQAAVIVADSIKQDGVSNKSVVEAIPIPSNLDECFLQLKKMFSKDELIKFKEDKEDVARANAHFGLGRWIRNTWVLPKGSLIKKYFNDLGITEADDMSGIIVTSFHRYLNNRGIKLDEQIKEKKGVAPILGHGKH